MGNSHQRRQRAEHAGRWLAKQDTAMKTIHKHCQSCGMPLKRDEQGGGTNADGTKSKVYCSHCFQRGKFVLPDITVKNMQTRVRAKLINFGMPGFLTGFFTKGIPKLERWRGQGQ